MSAAPAPSFFGRTLSRRPGVRRARPSRRTAWASEGLHRIEIIAPDQECAALLLEYASPLFPAELVPGAAFIVRLQPPLTGPGWAIELLALVERWLESAPLPCATVHYGGCSYLVRSSTHVAEPAVAARTPHTRRGVSLCPGPVAWIPADGPMSVDSASGRPRRRGA